ncbi:hypothetical protein [Hoyosella altamirensis]|uniref:Uncharacterized protein n=1 Tax=Hoyosella altamirensis TaxID=616997 RepID=A0A839RMB7_9ACTN|nr:hypothetical protein [Hoyosella altamirensis]MBB3038062.1 hypothetical protein [Hoyosella altamirensis]
MGISPKQAASTGTALVPGEGERVTGYGVMAAPFSSGHLLATRTFPVSSFGPPYSSVWHRDPEGNWTIYSDVEPAASCARFFSAALVEASQADVRCSWVTDSSMQVSIPGVLDWEFELMESPRTTIMNAVGKGMPEAMWRNKGVLGAMGPVAGRFLGLGHIGLAGNVPNGQWFRANPRLMWFLRTIRGSIRGQELGYDTPLREQVKLGDFWLPSRGIFAVGNSLFEPLDPNRHQRPERSR